MGDDSSITSSSPLLFHIQKLNGGGEKKRNTAKERASGRTGEARAETVGGAVHCTGSNSNADGEVLQDGALEAAGLFTLRFKIGSCKGDNVSAERDFLGSQTRMNVRRGRR